MSISIVLPLYNALSHLESGLRVIHSQTFPDWELVAVNDGSTDQTRERFFDLTKNWTQPVRLIDRENGGGFAARNTGLDHVSRRYIAFFDIDDIWYPHHLERLFSLMEGNPDVDWIYAACKLIDLTQGGKVIQASNFYQDGAPRPFLSLRTVPRVEIRLIDDERAAAVQFVSGLQIGQQFSLIRQRVFAEYRFRSDYRNEAADQVSVIAALKLGYRFAWLNEIHGEYVIHTGNASAGCRGAPLEKYLRLKRALIRGFKELDSEAELTLPELRALRERLSNEYFWALGYNLLLPAGLKSEALQAFRYGLFYPPFDLKKWKTFLLTLLRQYGQATLFSGGRIRMEAKRFCGYPMKVFLALLALSLSMVPPALSQSDYVNAVNLVRGTLGAKELPPCAMFRASRALFCPAVASNCPASHPVCRLTRVQARPGSRRVVNACRCANTTAANPQFFEPCKSGVNCTPVAVVLPTPTPTPTPRPIVTPTPRPTVTPTPVPTPNYTVLYMEAELLSTGMRARNGQTLTVRPGDVIQYRWGSPQAVSSYATYRIISGRHTCDFPASGYWPNGSNVQANLGGAGGTQGQVQPCQVGAVYEITFYPRAQNGAALPSAQVYVRVN